MPRPHLSKTGSELERLVDDNPTNATLLKAILEELRHRSTPTARRTEKKARGHLKALEERRANRSSKSADQPTSTVTVDRFAQFQEEVGRNWWDQDALLRHLGQAAQFDGEDAKAARARIQDRIAELSAEAGEDGAGELGMADQEQASRRTSEMGQERRWTEEAVADLRKKLIDLSKRNPLIAFKHTARGASHLRVVDERPDIIFEQIVEGSMGFEPLPDEETTPKDEQTPTFQIAYERARLTDEEFLAATEKLGDQESDARILQQAERALRSRVRRELGLPSIDYGKALDVKALAIAHGFDPSFDLKNSDDEGTEDHHEDDKLRVLLTRKELEKRLKTIWDRYRGHARETGLHTLFLVFGFVQWYEDDASDVALHAPLLLLPVQLERNLRYGRYEFRLVGGDEGLQVNVALVEKMRQLGLELPSLRDDETPEAYFIRAAGVLEKGTRLSLRQFVTLTVLPFPRMVLWMDLDPVNWPDGAFSDHRLLPVLLRARGTDRPMAMGETHNIDEPEWATKAPALIQPADASQHSALIDVVAGHSVAIEGPPGTGKSQTITNMIAAALNAGKKVLFVAEKQAALKVVADRLRHVGLGSMLLELHSDGTDRSAVYDSLRRRLAETGRSDESTLNEKRQQLAAHRDLIRGYLALIGEKLGAMKRTAHWLAWREIGLRSKIGRDVVERVLKDWRPGDPKRIDRIVLADARSKLSNFSDCLAAIDEDGAEGNRTLWIEAERLDAFNQTTEIAAARETASAASDLARISKEISDILGLDLPRPGSDLDAAVGQLNEIIGFEDLEEQVVKSALLNPDGSRALLARQARWRQIYSRLQEDVADPAAVSGETIRRLAEALTACRGLPDTVSAFRAELETIRSAIRSLGQTERDRNDLLQRLSLTEAVTVEDLTDVAAALAEIEAQTAEVKALLQPGLLDELAILAVQQERANAESLEAERAALAEHLRSTAFELAPVEIESLAGALENSGLFARMLGGGYRKARRETGRQLIEPIPDRRVAAELLRRLARNLRQSEAFRRESNAAAFFPAPLWRGTKSDWQSLAAASLYLKSTAERLTGGDKALVLDRWLALPHRERAVVGGYARAALPSLEAAVSLGFNDTIGHLAERLNMHEHDLSAVDRALAEMAVRDGGNIVRDGEPLSARLETLQASVTDFANLSSAAEFSWIGEIGEPLDALARALTHCDTLKEIPGPLLFLDGLRSLDEPIAALNRVVERVSEYSGAVEHWTEAESRLEDRTGMAINRLFVSGVTWQDLSKILQSMAADERGASLVADLLKYRIALREIGCEVLAALAVRADVPGATLADLYELALVRALLEAYLGGDGAELKRLGSLTLEGARKSFVRIDRELQDLEARAIVARRLTDKAPRGVDRGPRGEWTELSLLQHELGLRRPRTPIRDVTARAGAALQTLKPVWMMSPTSAAQYIQPGKLQFDLLIVDEASQMRPEYAVSAIMRGNQFVVVGDANQLPPTDFFAASTDDDGDGLGDGATMTVNTESILDLANERFRHRRRLKWHYRSQHEGLIQFSNRQFYERDLIVFPSPTIDDELLGVKHVYVGGQYEASINEAEAKAVIEEAFRLMRTYPERSIGIATMNSKQTELIRNEFDRLVLEASEVRHYIDSYTGTIDEFFIKNLENVQGDERDIILISTVYGPDKNGTVMQRFGPMNREVGWRRLNVLVTRAKLSTRVFTSLKPEDIRITENSSKGVQALRNYLNYARNGAQYDEATGGEPDSDFEVFVADALRDAGYEVVPQVGVEGFRIDLGVRHPDYPIGFIAGVECDGASYHSGLTVRDRDRIRQTVLEQMGWNIHRVWSTDWFADPSRETTKLIVQLDQWRHELAREYSNRPFTTTEELSETDAEEIVAEDIEIVEPAPPSAIAAPILAVPPAPLVDTNEPTGRPMRSLDGIDWYEVSKGHLYAVWIDASNGAARGVSKRRAGTVEVLSRATAAPHVYGGQLRVARSEYEGVVEDSGERFIVHDIHAAVREVARRAKA